MRSLAAVLVVVLLQGCFAGRFTTPTPREYASEQQMQWFTLGGLVPLSDPAGGECSDGIRKAEVAVGPVDFLITLSIGLLGAGVGYAICSQPSAMGPATPIPCAGVGAGLSQLLIGSRTVEYQCAGRRPSKRRAPAVEEPAEKAPASGCTDAQKEEMRAANVGEDAVKAACQTQP